MNKQEGSYVLIFNDAEAMCVAEGLELISKAVVVSASQGAITPEQAQVAQLPIKSALQKLLQVMRAENQVLKSQLPKDRPSS